MAARYKERATLWLSMSVHLIRYMNKLYFHTDNISASDTTMLLVPIYKSTQVTGTCTNLQNNTYHNEKSWATTSLNGIKRRLSPLISRGIQNAVCWTLTLSTFAVLHKFVVEHATSIFRDEGNGSKMMLKWLGRECGQSEPSDRKRG